MQIDVMNTVCHACDSYHVNLSLILDKILLNKEKNKLISMSIKWDWQFTIRKRKDSLSSFCEVLNSICKLMALHAKRKIRF